MRPEMTKIPQSKNGGPESSSSEEIIKSDMWSNPLGIKRPHSAKNSKRRSSRKRRGALVTLCTMEWPKKEGRKERRLKKRGGT